ncbi:PQQ-binding-like beta-propeller repeat protein [Halobacterium salinarum]|nr:PQQ-binding-like beta-propeller repeat protein [Halobacterium salinarum]MCF2168462.1 PQQ-binding-like beta-propeller repeat protein [Halobacterium salinarum]
MSNSVCTRRRLLATTGAVSVSAVAGCSSTLLDGDVEHKQDAPVGEVTGPWPTYQHDFARTGATTDPGPSSEATESTVLETPNAGIISQVSFADGRGVFGTADGEGNGGPYMSFQTDGKPRVWKTEVGLGSSPVTIAGDAVFGSTAEGIRVYDARNGGLCWQAKSGSAGNTNAPILTGETVLSCDSSSVVAHDAVTGQTKWTFTAEEIKDVGLRDDVVYVQLEASIAAVDPTSGDQLWRRFDLPETAAPIVIGDMTVYYSERGGKLYALSIADQGETKWKRSIPNDYTHSLAVSNNRIHVATTDSSDRGVLTTLDAADGSTINTEKHPDGRTSPPVVADGTQFWLGKEKLYASDAGTGSPKWSLELNATPTYESSLSVHGPDLCFVSKNGVVNVSDAA